MIKRNVSWCGWTLAALLALPPLGAVGQPGEASTLAIVAQGQPVGLILKGNANFLGELIQGDGALVVESSPAGDNPSYAGQYLSISLLADAHLADDDYHMKVEMGLKKINDDPAPIELSFRIGAIFYEFAFTDQETTFKGVHLDATRYNEVGVSKPSTIALDGSPFTMEFILEGDSIGVMINGELFHKADSEPSRGEIAIQVDRTWLYRDTKHEDVRVELNISDWTMAGSFFEPSKEQIMWERLCSPPKRLMKRVGNAYAYAEDHPELPNMLIVGDSISIYYTDPARRLLKGKVDVCRSPGGPGKAEGLFKPLERFLATNKFDIIHFNTGLHDLSRKEGTPEELAEYRKNLELIVQKLEATGAQLIWASTTPIQKTVVVSKSGLEKEYNKIAAEIMAEHNIPINDLHAGIEPRHDEYWLAPNNIHFNAAGSAVMGQLVADKVMEVIGSAPSNK